MVARPGEYRANCNAGELAPEVHGRTDLQQFYAGMAEMTNVEPVPQGGFRLMPRTRKLGRIRTKLAEIAPDAAANNSGVFAAPGTLAQIEFNEPQAIAAVRAVEFFSGEISGVAAGPVTFDSNGSDLGHGGLVITFRQTISAAALAFGGSGVTVKFRAATSENFQVNAAYIGHAAAPGSYAFEATPAQIFFNGGNAGFNIGAGTAVTSDEIAGFIVDGDKDLVISFQAVIVDASDQIRRATTLAGWQAYYKFGSDAATVAATGYAADGFAVAAVEQIELTAFAFVGPNALQLEYQAPDEEWHSFGKPFRISTTERSKFVALPPGEPVTAIALRCQFLLTPKDPTEIAISRIEAFAESGEYSDVRLRPFTFADDQTYVFVLTEKHADIYRDGVFVAGTDTPLLDQQIKGLDHSQRFDAMHLFHEDAETWQIFRDGADDEWRAQPVPFEAVPKVDLGGNYEHTPDEWMVYLRQSGLSHLGGVVVAVTVNGEETEGVEITGADNTARANNFAAALKTALEALPSVGEGVSVSVAGAWSNSTGSVKIAFTGEANDGHVFIVAAQVVSHTQAAATVGHTQIGKRGGEAIMSGSRGWPACGLFYNDRFLTAGFKARKSALLASATADYYNLNVDIAAATGAILLNLDTDGAERIQRLARSKHLVIFTSDAEYYVSDRALSRNSTPNIVECSRNGSAPTVPVGSNEGELLYISKNRSVAFAARYSDLAQSYESEPISLVASHLVDRINDAAVQRPESENDAARWWLVRDDGAMAAAILVRNQDIYGFVRWRTDGTVLAVCVDGANVPHIVVERMVDGEPVRFLERLERDLIFDCATEIDLAPANTTVTGLADYEGAEVWVLADGFIDGPYTVENGTIELAVEAGHVVVGRWTPPRARTLPVPRQVAERVVLERPVRVHTVRGDLIDTTSIAIGANGEAPEDVTLYHAGDAVDQPPAPFTGPIEVTGLVGWTPTGQVEITQIRPGWLQVRNFTIEARV